MDNQNLLMAMIEYFGNDPKRVQHFLKVYEFAKLIGREEKLSEETQAVLETAAIVHDIGIKIAEAKYGQCQGKLQEQEGPKEAERLLISLGYDDKIIRRVSYLVGHHHTYTEIEGMDYQILVEADFLVNMYEDEFSREAGKNTYDKIFKTESGRKICRMMYGLNENYNFYGWESAEVTPVNEVYRKIKSPRDLYDILSELWCADTCAPRMREKWSKENKTLGQCSITAFLVQDIFGGRVFGILRPGGNYHCYNVIGDCCFDLTSEQFGEEAKELVYENNPEQFREVHFAKEEKRLRYEYLKRALEDKIDNL